MKGTVVDFDRSRREPVKSIKVDNGNIKGFDFGGLDSFHYSVSFIVF